MVTSKALFDFHEETKKMRLLGVLKGLDPEDVIQGMGFKPHISEKLQELEPPKEDELQLLRQDIDPSGIIIRGEKMRVERIRL